MKLSVAISFFVLIITLSIAQPSGLALQITDSESPDAAARINGTVLQRPAGYATPDSNDNFEARQATICFVPIVLHKNPDRTVAEFTELIRQINENLERLQWLLPTEQLQIVIRFASCELGSSHTVNHRYYDIDLHPNTRIILDQTPTDGAGSQGIVAYIPTRVFPQEPTYKCVYAYSMFATDAASANGGRLGKATLAAPTELPRVPAPITLILTGIGVTLIYRTRQNNRCLHPIYLRQKPTIK